MNPQVTDINIATSSIKPKVISTHFQKKITYKQEESFDDYFIKFINLDSDGIVVINSNKISDFDTFLNINYHSIINFQRINDVRYINKYFKKINSLIPLEGFYIGTFESAQQKYKRIHKKYHIILAYPIQLAVFIIKRIFPKWKITKKIYFGLTKGKNRHLSIAEVLGRLVSCGFKITNYAEQNKKTYFVAKKIGQPSIEPNASYGPLFAMKRIGKNGKEIKVYKFRTMHPYSEYLQEFIHKKYNLNGFGKFNNDFRITSWGRVLRKYWLDEIPMLYNFLKGELKLIGVRPLSKHYLSLYSNELKELRLKNKPGLIPPYYADLPKTFIEILKSEEKYLSEFSQNPIKTDLKYFFMFVSNILLGKAHSS